MVFDAFVNPVLDPVLGPLLRLGPLPAVLIISFLISLLITIVYKLATDQNLMKELKTELKELQAEMKSLKHDPQKAMEVQKKAMERNMKYMMHSLKPTLFTFIPLIIIFGWLNTHMAYIPITPGSEFVTVLHAEKGVHGNATLGVPPGMTILSDNPQEVVNETARWTVKADEEGTSSLSYDLFGKIYGKDIIVKANNGYKPPIVRVSDGIVDSLEVVHEKIVVVDLFGWKVGWLGSYIIFSLLFSMALRKVMKVY